MIKRIIVGPKDKESDVYTIFNLEMKDNQAFDQKALEGLFYDSLIEKIVTEMPAGKFMEVMYHNGVIDPAQDAILKACAHKGIKVEAAKVSHRYYGLARLKVFVNKKVHMKFISEPALETLKPRGSRQGMKLFDLTAMSDQELVKLSEDRELALSLEEMKQLTEFQKRDKMPAVTDVFLETFGARWSDHCVHKKWQALGLFKILKDATRKIKNSNLVSAFVDNAGGWKFFGRLVAVLKLETHCSPTQMEPYGGQLTKLGGVIRDILYFALGALPIGNLELTVVGEFVRRRYRWLKGRTLTAKTIASETIRAIADYGNPMGIPMLLARMFSHPAFGGKTFALGGTVGITTKVASQKGRGLPGDYVVLVGGRTGNDGIHGATVSSGEITEKTDTGDSCHVQIGNAYTEQKMMPSTMELLKIRCVRAKNDCGAAGIISAAGELGETANGILLNIALVLLKCLGLENWQIVISESQERGIDVIKRNKLRTAMAIYKKYDLEATVIGVITGNGRFQIVYDENLKKFDAATPLSGEICLDVPYAYFDELPMPKIEVVVPPPKTDKAVYPEINLSNVALMANKVVKHFDVCNQAWATTQYDSTVQGKTYQGPLYGVNYDIPSSLAVLLPVYGRQWGLTLSQSFSPWQFEVDPVQAAENAMLDALITQVIAGVKLTDICLADNFYTPSKDKYAYWYLSEQVKVLSKLSVEMRTPFITGKDSSSGSSTFNQQVINVLISVCITAMGKIRDARKLRLHQWQTPGNLIYAIGPQAKNLDGSILSSALDITGTSLDNIRELKTSEYMETVSRLCRSEAVVSAVPINRGGIILRLFEGVEASGYGFEAELCKELFPESFGTALIEVKQKDATSVERWYSSLEPMLVGQIVSEKGLTIQGKELNWERLHKGWDTTFERMVT